MCRFLPFLLICSALVALQFGPTNASEAEVAESPEWASSAANAEEPALRQRRSSQPAFNNTTFDFPLLIPPYNRTGGLPIPEKDPSFEYGSCLLYMESLEVLVIDAKKQEAGVAVIGIVRNETEQPFGYHTNANYTFDSSENAFKCLPVPVSNSSVPEKFW